jgi:hypothetical protein
MGWGEGDVFDEDRLRVLCFEFFESCSFYATPVHA